ncbi:MAG TPA: hypothetical protein VJW95_05205 [Dissulfurispiraceae bacterium]|nr:hypothetical protein [Dissulfurispiraceae bacterium]
MRMKSIITLLVAMVFTLGMVSLTFAADAKEAKGTVTKVAGMMLTIKDAAGKEVTIKASNAKDVKVGEMVTVKDGKATKEAAPAAPVKKKSTGGY